MVTNLAVYEQQKRNLVFVSRAAAVHQRTWLGVDRKRLWLVFSVLLPLSA